MPEKHEFEIHDREVPTTVKIEIRAPKSNGKKTKCTFDSCHEVFDCVQDMKRHKKYSIEHDYCVVCDEDFPDWDSYSSHNARWSGMDYFGKTKAQIDQERTTIVAAGVYEGMSLLTREMMKAKEKDPKKRKMYGELKHHKWGCKFCGKLFESSGGREQHLNEVCLLSITSLPHSCSDQLAILNSPQFYKSQEPDVTPRYIQISLSRWSLTFS
jgi:hypothetical protein